MISMCDLKQQCLELKNELDPAILEVTAEGQYILGPNIKAFDQDVAAYCGCRYATGVGSGTDTPHLTLRTLEIGPEDEASTTPFTFITTNEVILMVGATPVFVDTDPGSFNIAPHQIEAAITPRTRATLPVHLCGQRCDTASLVEVANRRILQAWAKFYTDYAVQRQESTPLPVALRKRLATHCAPNIALLEKTIDGQSPWQESRTTRPILISGLCKKGVPAQPEFENVA